MSRPAYTFIVKLEPAQRVMQPGALKTTTVCMPRMRTARLVGEPAYWLHIAMGMAMNDNEARA